MQTGWSAAFTALHRPRVRSEEVSQQTEPPSLDDEWRKMTSGYGKGKMAETDSYLAAFALAGNCCLVTFDHGFREFRRLKTSILR